MKPEIQKTPPDSVVKAVAQALSGRDGAWLPLSGGRVNTLWRLGDTVIKVYRPDGASPLFPNDPAAEARALRLLYPHGLVPALLAQGDDWLAYRYLPGAAWRQGAQNVAVVLSRLHQIAVAEGAFRNAANGSAEIMENARSIAGQCLGSLPPMPPDPGVLATTPCLIHGDAVPGNLIADQGRIMLIDWQCPAIGDPADDISTFLSPAMQYLYRGVPLSPAEVAAFRAACPAAVLARYDRLAALYHWRMAAHCLWKAERGGHDYAPAMRLELDALEGVAQSHTT